MNKIFILFSLLLAFSAHAQDKQYYNWKLTQENKVLNLEIKDPHLKGETEKVLQMLSTSNQTTFCSSKEEIISLKSKYLPNINRCKATEQFVSADKSETLLLCDNGAQGVRLILETQGENIVGKSDVLIDTPEILMRGNTIIFIEKQESCNP